MNPLEAAALSAVSLAAGAIATVSGFGIGSLLTPLLALRADPKLAVAAVAIPHFAATFLRFWLLRRHLDLALLRTFGAASAVGGLLGALLHSRLASRGVTLAFGALLVATGLGQLSGLSARLRFGQRGGFLAGALSGFFGGLAGNQGGIRSAALLSLERPLSKEAFVAVATAAGVIVDLARLPVYLAVQPSALWDARAAIALATAGTVAGTLAGRKLLSAVPEKAFRSAVAALVLALGLWVLARA